ncbi:AI-2E family transporter [Intrasporangium calvum]|uniref:AI-2E family transporter n=1 Tax=Intrasporangium calvum TaxID=53358 RepID=A0ABT5GLL2_9MICO|nr:AI-2E family transporter [Intrasporangium calvum]MDC5699062.1 AI-2E family transporter [Intrasporangium calvum]
MSDDPGNAPAEDHPKDQAPEAASDALEQVEIRAPRTPDDATDVQIHLNRYSIWRAAWVVVAVIALAALARFVLSDAGGVIFTLILAFLASIAMEPAVSKLSQSMKRGLATAIVMFGSLLSLAAFIFVFGRLLSDQIGTFAESVPALLEDLTKWASDRFGIDLDYQKLLDRLGVGTSTLTTVAQNLAGGVLGFLVSVVAAAFSTLTFAFFTYYFSADGPRLRRWIAQLVPPRQQEMFGLAWDLAVRKTGGYVSARVVLAAINGALSAAFMLVIGMDYWLALGIWTGVIAQFVPTVGTYIAIALPVVIGLIGDQPWQGLAVLAFAVVYQQIENITLEPRISASAVNVHPAVSFGAVLFGASLFGIGGAFVAVPVAALLLALFDIYSHKYELVPDLAELQPGEREVEESDGDADLVAKHHRLRGLLGHRSR